MCGPEHRDLLRTEGQELKKLAVSVEVLKITDS